MKKEILILLFSLLSILIVNGQNNLAYKPLAEFKSDTTAFIVYNFMERAASYKGKTVNDIVLDLKIPIKDSSMWHSQRGTKTGGMFIYIYTREYRYWLSEQKKDINAIFVTFETPTERLELKEVSTWDQVFKLYKDMKIKELLVVIPEYSKYYRPDEDNKTRSVQRKYKYRKFDNYH